MVGKTSNETRKKGDESCSNLQHLDVVNQTERENRKRTTSEDRTRTA